MKYDIFISYRRKDSSGRSNVPTARQFKLALEAPPYNYKVFFDYSECTDNYFSDIILPAIRTCDFFVLVLTKDCLLRCSNDGDWVRREIEEAIAYNRKIIPITPDKECEFIPSGLPASLRKLDGLQITTVYTDHMFEACVEFLVKNRFHVDTEAEHKAEEYNGHEYVDLDLPSGTLWATCNIGASKPEVYGDYYAWGETSTKYTYDIDTYKYANGDYDKLTKYCSMRKFSNKLFKDNLTALQADDDSAVSWGSGWSTPTKEQWDELLNHTTNHWTTQNGVKGRLFTAKNGRTLFLPAAGTRCDSELVNAGSDGYYWSRSLYTDLPSNAWYLYFNLEYCNLSNCGRNYGLSVRLVRQN